MIDPNATIKTFDASDVYISDLHDRINKLEQQLRFAAGYISATPQWSNKHPEEVLQWVKSLGEPENDKSCTHLEKNISSLSLSTDNVAY